MKKQSLANKPGKPVSLKRDARSATLKAFEKREREIELSRLELREKERMLTTLMSNLDGMVYRCRNDKRWTMEFVNEGCHRLTGYHPAELVHNKKISYEQIEHPEDRARVRAEINAALVEQRRFLVEYRIQCRDGTIKWVWERGVGILDDDARVIAFEGFIEDVTERKLSIQALQQAEYRFRSMFENSTEGIFQTAPDGRYLNVNPALARIYGYDTPAELMAGVRDIRHLLYTDRTRRAEFLRLMNETDAVSNFTSEILRSDGSKIWISESARAVHDDAGNLLFHEGTVEDITATRLNQEKLVYLASHDALTNLPNRLLMNERLRQMMLSAQRKNSIVAVVLVDLDNFKLINDTYGHNRGDQLLQSMAHRMLACVRETDTVARLGGDEFVLLLSGERRGEAMSQVTQRVLHAIARPLQIEGRDFSVSSSLGVSIFPRDGRDVQTLLKNADTAMYKAKEFGRNNFQFYSTDMNEVIAQRLELQTTLRKAIENGQFVLLYQPKVDLVSGQVAGMEALLRIKDGENGLLMPQNFIHVAEQTGLIIPIGEWVMREACRYTKSLHDRGLPAMRVAVNLSARQLTRYELVRAVEQALRDAGLAAEFLELELTESMVMDDPEAVIATLEELRLLGVSLSIDDFGTGYSSLSYLKRFPVSNLKIDQSFVRDLGVGKDTAAIVKAIISLGHSLEMKVIAEGVETQEQLSFLLENGCDAMQGFLFSRPLAADEFTALVERESNCSDKESILKRLCPSYGSEQLSIRNTAAVTGILAQAS